MWLGVIYDSQATNRKQGGLSVRTHPRPPDSLLLVTWELYKKDPAPPSSRRTPIGHLGVIETPFQPSIHKNKATNRWMPLIFCSEKCQKKTFLW
jgi:hypothetical protein